MADSATDGTTRGRGGANGGSSDNSCVGDWMKYIIHPVVARWDRTHASASIR